MPSHRHHTTTTPPLPIDSQPEPVNSRNSSTHKFSKFGFEELDPGYLEMMLVLSTHPDAKDYVLMVVEMARDSKAYQKVRETVRETAAGDVESDVAVMFALGMLTGASCMLMAVDEGLVEDSREYEDDEEGGGGSGSGGDDL